MLWTDFITPAELTGYVRASQEDYEVAKGTLAKWLPNRLVPDTTVRFMAGGSGLVDEARYRAYDAEPEIIKGVGGNRITLELPAISVNQPISEYQQLRGRAASDEQIRNWIIEAAVRGAQAIADRTERQRGNVLVTGAAAINQDNYVDTTPFGRDASMSVVATKGQQWTDPSVDRLGFLEGLLDQYVSVNGEEPGAFVMSQKVLRALSSGSQFATQLNNGASRPAVQGEVQMILTSAGLPDITVYNRRTKSGRVLPEDTLLLLPAPCDPNDGEGTQLGATFWGQTLTSMDPSYQLEPVEQPGIVAGVYRGEKPPMIAEVVADAIAMPVLANANLSLAAKVL